MEEQALAQPVVSVFRTYIKYICLYLITSAPCMDTYYQLNGKRGRIGSPRPGITDTAQCEAACSAMSGCRGVDFYPGDPVPCRVYSGGVGSLVVDPSSNHLVRGTCYYPPPTTPGNHTTPSVQVQPVILSVVKPILLHRKPDYILLRVVIDLYY